MPAPDSVFTLSPTDYERKVKAILDASSGRLEAYTSHHLQAIHGSDGEYTFDVTARFEALGVRFLVLVECKRLRRPVERGPVQVLHSKMQSVAAQKGMLFATCGFQKGALDYAQAHGIALVRLANEHCEFISRAGDDRNGAAVAAAGSLHTGDCCGWLQQGPRLLQLSSQRPWPIEAVLNLHPPSSSSIANSTAASREP